MSLITSAATSAAAPAVSFLSRGHKKGGHSGAEGARTDGQAPTSTQGLLSNLLQSIEQIIGISVTSAASAPTTAPAATGANAAVNAAPAATSTVAPATAGATPEVQGFMHSLLNALKADGLGKRSGEASPTIPGGVAAGTAADGTAGAGAAGRYGSLTASLQTLIQQVNGNAPTTPATAGLKASFDTLAQAGAPAAAAQTSLQGLLTNLLQKVENSGTQSVRALGANVNANV